MSLREKFGNRLNAVRLRKKLTQAKLAELTDVTMQYVGMIERGEASPSFRLVEKLCQVLSVEPVELFMSSEHSGVETDSSGGTDNSTPHKLNSQMEKSLAHNEYCYQEIIDHAPMAVYGKDLDGHYTFINKHFEKLSGYSSQKVLGRTDYELFPSDVAKNSTRNDKKVIETNSAMEMEEFAPVNGEIHSFISGKFPIRNRKSEDIELVGISVDITSQKQLEKELREALATSTKRGQAVNLLLQGAKSLLNCAHFADASQNLFDASKRATGATTGYIALLSKDQNEPKLLYLDSSDRRNRGINLDSNMRMCGLTEVAYREKRCVHNNDFPNSPWARLVPDGHIRLESVLFAPLIIDDEVVGFLCLANKPGGFHDRDLELAGGFADMAAVTLHHSRDKEEKEALLNELEKTLNEVRQLSGILPICCNCKKIRNNEGYWETLEAYFQQRSEVNFTHGICPECARKLYPDFYL